jgi:hypothetical protein
MEKKTPIDPMPMGTETETSEFAMLTTLINSCKPDAKKKESPHGQTTEHRERQSQESLWGL